MEKRKANQEEIQVVAKHEEVPKEDATADSIAALKDQYGEQYLSAGPLTAKEMDPGRW
jgi:hypothetical protein